MTTQSVMTKATNPFTNRTGGVTNKGKQPGNSFGFFVNNNGKTAQISANGTEATPVKKISGKSQNAKDDTTNSAKDVLAAKNDSDKANEANPITTKKEDNQTDPPVDDTKVVKDEKASNKLDDPSQDPQVVAQLEAMLQTIKETVMNQLNLSTEQFDQLMSDQGMTLTDLLQPENLQQLVLANYGATEITAVLTDENLANTMNQLMQTVEDIKSDQAQGLTNEQMKSILLQAELSADSSSMSNADDVITDIEHGNNELSNTVQSVNVLNDTVNKDLVTDKSPVKSDSHSSQQLEQSIPVSLEQTDVKAGTDSEDKSNDLMNLDTFQTFVDNLVNMSQGIQTDFSDEISQVTNLREIANQIIETIKVSVSENNTSMELQLNPESLGKVNLSVHSKDGVMTAHFVVQNEISKEAIESQIHTLRDTLNQQGIKVEAIEVTVSANAFDQNSSKGSGNDEEAGKNNNHKKITLEDALNMTEVSEEESVTEEDSVIMGSMIDYTA